MEPVGLAVGIAGLAGLFRVGLDILEIVDSYKDIAVDSRAIIAQFEADKLLHQKWGKCVGIYKTKLDENYHENLNDPQTFSSVEKILSSIKELDDSADTAVLTLQTTSRAEPKSSLDGALLPRVHTQSQKLQETTSKRKRIGWALRGKARFVAQVQQFGALVQRLHSLVPPDGIRGAGNVYNGPMGDDLGSLNGTYFPVSQLDRAD
jgi:hypothetical protein